jgi:hypothetical protein
MKSPSSFGLLLQMLSVDERVLAVATVVAASTEDGSFTAAEATSIFDKLWVPRPRNIHDQLGALAKGHFVRRATKPRHWAVTPLGRDAVRKLLSDLDVRVIEAQLKSVPGSEFAHVRHTLVTPAFAPLKWITAINRLLEQFPFEQNVFLMTRFPESPSDTHYLDPVRELIPLLRDALFAHGLKLHVASDRQLDDDLLANVAAHMWASNYGIGILEDRINRGLNYNVMTEIGAMLMTGRRCALMKDTTVPKLPTDLAGQIFKSVDLRIADQVVAAAHTWASRDLGLGACRYCCEDPA